MILTRQGAIGSKQASERGSSFFNHQIAAVALSLVLVFNNIYIFASKHDAVTSAAAQRTPKLADGCYHVFMDVGANIGVHGRFLLEPHKYPKATLAEAFFVDLFGPNRDNRDVCVFAFEPNPAHHGRLGSLSAAYANMGWRYHVVPVGVSDEKGTLNFYRRNDVHYNEWGFSVAKPPPAESANITVEIPVVRLAQWIEDHVEGRLLPETVHGSQQNTKKGPQVLMKLDIESMEFRVFPDLLLSGVFCRDIDVIFGEVHRRTTFFPFYFSGPKESRKSFQNIKEAGNYWSSLLLAATTNPHCRGSFVEADDEIYLMDGEPFP